MYNITHSDEILFTSLENQKEIAMENKIDFYCINKHKPYAFIVNKHNMYSKT